MAEIKSLFNILIYILMDFFIKVTTDGSRRLYAITGLKKDQDYQIKLAAMTVNVRTHHMLSRILNILNI